MPRKRVASGSRLRRALSALFCASRAATRAASSGCNQRRARLRRQRDALGVVYRALTRLVDLAGDARLGGALLGRARFPAVGAVLPDVGLGSRAMCPMKPGRHSFRGGLRHPLGSCPRLASICAAVGMPSAVVCAPVHGSARHSRCRCRCVAPPTRSRVGDVARMLVASAKQIARTEGSWQERACPRPARARLPRRAATTEMSTPLPCVRHDAGEGRAGCAHSRSRLDVFAGKSRR